MSTRPNNPRGGLNSNRGQSRGVHRGVHSDQPRGQSTKYRGDNNKNPNSNYHKKNSNDNQDQQVPTKKEIQEKQRQKIWVILFR